MVEKIRVGGWEHRYIRFLFCFLIWLFLWSMESHATINVSILDPNDNETFWTSALGYFQYSTDGINWSSKMIDQDTTLWYKSGSQGIYIRHIKGSYTLKDIMVYEGSSQNFYSKETLIN